MEEGNVFVKAWLNEDSSDADNIWDAGNTFGRVWMSSSSLSGVGVDAIREGIEENIMAREILVRMQKARKRSNLKPFFLNRFL